MRRDRTKMDKTSMVEFGMVAATYRQRDLHPGVAVFGPGAALTGSTSDLMSARVGLLEKAGIFAHALAGPGPTSRPIADGRRIART